MMDVREIRTSLQNDAKDGYNVDGLEILNIWPGVLQIELCACQDFGCESAGDTINTAAVGWCDGTSSGSVSQVRTG